MKLNWGKGIAIVMISFMAFILYMVFQMFGANVDLVEEDYYQQEVKYDERIEALKNSLKFKDELEIIIEDEVLRIVFPEGLNISKSEGLIHLYNSSNASLDKVYPILTSTGNEQIIILKDHQGSYTIKMKLNIDDLDYYFEKEIIL